jgi:hypothetical protein
MTPKQRAAKVRAGGGPKVPGAIDAKEGKRGMTLRGAQRNLGRQANRAFRKQFKGAGGVAAAESN